MQGEQCSKKAVNTKSMVVKVKGMAVKVKGIAVKLKGMAILPGTQLATAG